MGPEVLLSAMFLDDESYIDTLNIHTDCVVVNQCEREGQRESVRTFAGVGDKTEDGAGNSRIVYIETKERGLSKSRNMAITAAAGPVCILCDNDVEYVPDYDRKINDAFSKYPDADVIVFFIKRPERSAPVFLAPRKMWYLSVMKIFSPEIAFRKKSIEGIKFDERFGAGARFFLGEENLFLYDCLKRKKKVMYVPEMIAKVRDEESTWFCGYNREFFISRGANYGAMTRAFSPLLILQFAVRKRSLYSKDTKMFDAIKHMFAGRREYLGLK